MSDLSARQPEFGAEPALRLADVPWHPMLFAATIVLAYWLDTVVSPHAAFRSLLVAVGGAGILTMLVWGAIRRPARAGIIVTAVIVLLYSRHLLDIAEDVRDLAPLWLFVLWVAAIAAAIAIGIRVLRRWTTGWTARRVNGVLNWAGLIYLLTTIGMGLLSGKIAYGFSELEQGSSLDEVVASGAAAVDVTQEFDIYLILLDGYPRADVLDEAFEIDNSGFVSALEERGFDIASKSHSDYLWTRQSLISMLHMDRVERIPRFMDVIEGRAPQNPDLRELTNENPAFELARENGYQVIATGYPFEEVALRHADVYLDPRLLNEFEFKLIVSTFLGDLVALTVPDFASAHHREWINFQLRSLEAIGGTDTGSQARLVIGHIPAPHQPAVFGPNGEPIVIPMSRSFHADSPIERGEGVDEFVAKYRDQLVYLNKRFLEMVDGIMANSNEPPVIILWSDHGSASRVDWNVTSPEEAHPSHLRERTSTLFAALTPGEPNLFPDDITPAGIFRLLVDGYFANEYGQLPTRAGYGN